MQEMELKSPWSLSRAVDTSALKGIYWGGVREQSCVRARARARACVYVCMFVCGWVCPCLRIRSAKVGDCEESIRSLGTVSVKVQDHCANHLQHVRYSREKGSHGEDCLQKETLRDG